MQTRDHVDGTRALAQGRRLTRFACAFRFFDTFLLIIPFYTVMFADRGLPPGQIGLALAAWSLTCLVLEVPSGALADLVSRRWLLFAAELAQGACFLLWIIAPNFWGFLGGLALWGVKSALTSGTFEALLFDRLTELGLEDRFARLLGASQAARFSGMMAASLCAALAAGTLSYDAMLGASTAACLLAALLALSLPRAPRGMRHVGRSYVAQLKAGFVDAARLPGVVPMMLFISGVQAIGLAVGDYWQLFGREVGLGGWAIALLVAAISGAEALASALSHRTGPRPGAGLAVIVCVSGVLLVGAALAYTPLACLPVILGVALARLADVSANTLFQHRLRSDTRATVASVKGLVTQVATMVLMAGFGLFAQLSAYRSAFAAFGAAMALMGLWGLRLMRNGAHPPAAS